MTPLPDAVIDGLPTLESIGNWLQVVGDNDPYETINRYQWKFAEGHPWVGLRIVFEGQHGLIGSAIPNPQGYIMFDVLFDEPVYFLRHKWPAQYEAKEPPMGIEAYRRQEHRIPGFDLQRLATMEGANE